MPEISDAELRTFARYQNLGTPEEVTKKIGDLETDNKSQRDQIRELKKNQPGAEQVIVPKQDADLLEKYRGLGEPKDLTAKLEAGETAAQQLAVRNRRDAAMDFIRAAGLAEETVDTLISLPALSSATFEVKKEKVTDDRGRETETTLPFIVLTDDDGKEQRFAYDKAQETFPALRGLKSAAPEKPGQQTTPRFVQQSPGDKGGSSETVFDRIRREKAEEQEAARKKAQDTKSVDERLGFVRPL